MTNDADLDALADLGYEQHFLVNEMKLGQLVAAAGIRPTDTVVELGAGAGTVARRLPPCRRLILVELDGRLAALLREQFPSAEVRQSDALDVMNVISCDVLLGNLPSSVTEQLLELVLPRLRFRTAILAVGEESQLGGKLTEYQWTELTTITGTDFRPPQPSISRLVKVTRLATTA